MPFSSGATSFGKGNPTFRTLFTGLEDQIIMTEGFTDEQTSKFLSRKQTHFHVIDVKHLTNNNPYLLSLICSDPVNTVHRMDVHLASYDNLITEYAEQWVSKNLSMLVPNC